MSWKGFSKAMARFPQVVKQKAGSSKGTVDPEFAEMEQQVQRIEKFAQKLSQDAKKYSESVRKLNNTQLNFATLNGEVLKPVFAGSQPTSRENSNLDLNATNSKGEALIESYLEQANIIKEREEDNLRLCIDNRIIEPLGELVSLMATVRKRITKRSHKLLDLDRHQATLEKLQQKKEKNASDEQKMIKQEQLTEGARMDFEEINGILKADLPALFELFSELLEPIFESLYCFQLHFFRNQLETLQSLVGETVYEKDQIMTIYHEGKEESERLMLEIEILQKSLKRSNSSIHSNEDNSSPSTTSNTAPSSYSRRSSTLGITGAAGTVTTNTAKSNKSAANPFEDVEPSPSGALFGASVASAATANAKAGANPFDDDSSSTGNPFAQNVLQPKPTKYNPFEERKKPGQISRDPSLEFQNLVKRSPPKPQPPKPRAPATPPRRNITYALALYDFVAQAPGDLSFHANDRIEITTKTENAEDWWKGRINGGPIGSFPSK